MNASNSRQYARACKLGTVALAIATLTSQVEAVTSTVNLNVSASVLASCTLSVANALNFGAYSAAGANGTNPLDATGMVISNCTPGTAGYLTIGQGTNATGVSTDAAPVRRMRSGVANYLLYNLFTDGTRTTSWANTTITGVTITGDGLDQFTTVYGRMPQGQSVPVGSYTDTVAVTLTY